MSQDTSTDTPHPHHSHGEEHFRSHRPRLTGWILMMVTALVVVAVGFVGVELGHAKSPARSTIIVTGSGTVRGIPDTVNFQIGVSTQAYTATGALAANDNKVRLLEVALLKKGVTRIEMQTSDLNIYANTNDRGVVIGFSVQDTLNVTMHRVKLAGAAIDAAARAVGNGIQFDGVTFSITNNSSLFHAARIRAMHSAYLAAGQIAQAGGARVTGIVKITDVENQSSPVYLAPTAFNAEERSAVPLETGSQPVNVQVTVIYSLAS
jgi:hypothetical protein